MQYMLEPAPKEWGRFMTGRGNCTEQGDGIAGKPRCTCLCRKPAYNRFLDMMGRSRPEVEPWQDPFNRDVGPGKIMGTTGEGGCWEGYEGIVDPAGLYLTCHLQIKVPNDFELYTLTFTILLILGGILALIGYWRARAYLRRRYLLKKAERRRSRKSSESSLSDGPGMRGRNSSENIGR
jgi:hypothetical protein